MKALIITGAAKLGDKGLLNLTVLLEKIFLYFQFDK